MFPSPAESAPSLKNMSKKNAVSFVRSEPAFIQKFKEKIGYKEEPDINAKKAKMPDFSADDYGDQPDKDDEKPVVVVLKKGDLTAEEANDIQTQLNKEGKNEPPVDGKITFKKPEKRSSKSTSDLDVSTAKKKKDIKIVKSNSKKVKDTKLLSFGDDEDNDEDT